VASVEPSILAATVRVPLARIRKELEARVPVRVAAESDQDIGTAGRLTYTVDRGPFSFAVNDGKLSVRTDLTSRASVCKPLGPLGCQPYASCTPTARMEATLPIALSPKWKVGSSTVRIDVVKGCQVTPLGIDVTPEIERRIAVKARAVQAQIDRAIPSLQPAIESGWGNVQGVLPIGSDACAFAAPSKALQGPASIVDDQLVARGAIIASPTVEEPCPAPPPPKPPPDLVQDPSLGDSFTMRVPVRMSNGSVAAVWKKQLAVGGFTVGSTALHVADVSVRGAREGVVVDLALTGDVCGTVSLLGAPVWDAEKRMVTLATLAPRAGEAKRLESAGARVDLGAFAAAVGAKIHLELPIDEDYIARSLVELEPLVPSKGPALAVELTRHRCEAVVWTSSGVEARFVFEGKASITVN
jgi:hypothetical protein